MDSILATPDTQTVLALVVGAVVALSIAVLLPRAPKPKSSKPGTKAPVSRWRLFLVNLSSMQTPGDPDGVVLAEEADGCRYVARAVSRSLWRVHAELPGDSEPARRRRRKRKNTIEIRRRGVLSTRWEAREGGKEWITVRPAPRKKKAPEIRCRGSARGLEVGGDLRGRDYEIRRDGRVVATLTPDDSDANADRHRLEVLRSEDPAPSLALVLCLDAVLTRSRSRSSSAA